MDKFAKQGAKRNDSRYLQGHNIEENDDDDSSEMEVMVQSQMDFPTLNWKGGNPA